jgi:hypothetical protein
MSNPLPSILKNGPAMVVATLVGLGSVAFVGWKARDIISPAEAAPARVISIEEVKDLHHEMEKLTTRLDAFNTRLSWLEGATSGALKTEPPPEVRAAGAGR